MSLDSKYIVQILGEVHRYPISHWSEISCFVNGDSRDPRNLFYLAGDVWDVWQYAKAGLPSKPGEHRFRFGHLHSFLKPYIKWYCYQRLLANNGTLSRGLTILPSLLTRADTYLTEHHYESSDDITSESDFVDLWNAHLLPQKSADASGTKTVRIQKRANPFWKSLQRQFGFPHIVPLLAPYKQFRLTEANVDEHQLIPIAVINQFVNKLALHRNGREPLNQFHHLRLCVLILTIALGRRINEILAAPRGVGQEGPLTYYPAKGHGSKGALWFEFSPNKNGPQNRAYVSYEWEDIVTYCVKTFIHYSDEIRDFASSEIQKRLILISSWNQTSSSTASGINSRECDVYPSSENEEAFVQTKRQRKKEARALSYDALRVWLYDHNSGSKNNPSRISGILRQWNITADGSSDGEIYLLRTHQARHTRQSAIASDGSVPLLTKQRDLNHVDRNMQVHYQHNARKQNEVLMQKVEDGQMVGPAMQWMTALFNAKDQQAGLQSHFQTGQPQLLSPRWRNLIVNNPQFMQFTRVPCGYCTLAQGPAACEEYMNCLEAQDGGCQWFLTDPENGQMLIQITQTVRKHQQQERESTVAGQQVQAGKVALLARRAEAIEKEVLLRSNTESLSNSNDDIKTRLKARKREIEEGSL